MVVWHSPCESRTLSNTYLKTRFKRVFLFVHPAGARSRGGLFEHRPDTPILSETGRLKQLFHTNAQQIRQGVFLEPNVGAARMSPLSPQGWGHGVLDKGNSPAFVLSERYC